MLVRRARCRDPWTVLWEVECVDDGVIGGVHRERQRRSPVEGTDLEQRPRLTLADESRQDQQFEKCDITVGGDGLWKRNCGRWRRDAIDGDSGRPRSLAVAMAELRRKLLNQPAIARVPDAKREGVERAGGGGHVSLGESDDRVADAVALHQALAPHTAAKASAARHTAASRPIRQTMGRAPQPAIQHPPQHNAVNRHADEPGDRDASYSERGGEPQQSAR